MYLVSSFSQLGTVGVLVQLAACEKWALKFQVKFKWRFNILALVSEGNGRVSCCMLLEDAQCSELSSVESQVLSVSPGVQRQIVHCVEKLAGIVEEQYCDTLTRPDDQQRTCNEEPCPARSVVSLLLFLNIPLSKQSLQGQGEDPAWWALAAAFFPLYFPPGGGLVSGKNAQPHVGRQG